MRKKVKKKPWKCCGKIYPKYSRYVRHRHKRHAEQVAKARESQQQREYGQSNKEFEQQLKKQKRKCWICHRPARNRQLHQEHNHKLAQLKIKVFFLEPQGYWEARNEEYGYRFHSRNKKKAIKEVRRKLLRRSRRGITCWQCNAGLRKFQQKHGWVDPTWLHRAGDYMEKYNKEQEWGPNGHL